MGLALWHAVGWLERYCLAWKDLSGNFKHLKEK
jgi:hypothetical protein